MIYKYVYIHIYIYIYIQQQTRCSEEQFKEDGGGPL